MDAEQLRQYLEFYQDLGIRTLYRREANNADVGQAGPEGAQPANRSLSILPASAFPNHLQCIRSRRQEKGWGRIRGWGRIHPAPAAGLSVYYTSSR